MIIMKYLLIIAIIFSCNCYGQSGIASMMPGYTGYTTLEYRPFTGGTIIGSSLQPNYRTFSTYDTTVLNEGDKSCDHNWAVKSVYEGMYSSPGISCLVNHGPGGCPDRWSNEKHICTTCLRHIQIKETVHIEEIKNPYDEALERLEKSKKK